MTLQKANEYKPYPRFVEKKNEDGVINGSKRVNSAEEEAEFLGVSLEEIQAKNEKRKLGASEQLKAAEELASSAAADKKAAEDILEQAKRLSQEADEKLAKASQLQEAASSTDSGQDNEKTPGGESPDEDKGNNINRADDVPEGNKDLLEKYAKQVLGVDLDKRKSFATLLDECKQIEAQNA